MALMISRWIENALQVGIDARNDWVVDIPDEIKKDIAAFLTASPESSYKDWFDQKYAHEVA